MAEQTFRVRTWVRADDEQAREGLVGFLSLFVGEDLIVDNVTLRRTLDGRYSLSWPARTDKHGKKHSSVRPVSDEVRRRIEREILAELAQREGVNLGRVGKP
jgi:DNA-binding cell septation regulator SpoVG